MATSRNRQNWPTRTVSRSASAEFRKKKRTSLLLILTPAAPRKSTCARSPISKTQNSSNSAKPKITMMLIRNSLITPMRPSRTLTTPILTCTASCRKGSHSRPIYWQRHRRSQPDPTTSRQRTSNCWKTLSTPRQQPKKRTSMKRIWSG